MYSVMTSGNFSLLQSTCLSHLAENLASLVRCVGSCDVLLLLALEHPVFLGEGGGGGGGGGGRGRGGGGERGGERGGGGRGGKGGEGGGEENRQLLQAHRTLIHPPPLSLFTLFCSC